MPVLNPFFYKNYCIYSAKHISRLSGGDGGGFSQAVAEMISLFFLGEYPKGYKFRPQALQLSERKRVLQCGRSEC